MFAPFVSVVIVLLNDLDEEILVDSIKWASPLDANYIPPPINQVKN